jgi:hypothetical protein
MKRIALTLAAFALTGALAFAQDAAAPVAKIGVEVNTGFVVSNNSTNTTTKPYAIDYGPGGSYLGPVVGVSFDLAGSNFGYSIEPITKGYTGPGNSVIFDHAYAWVVPVDGLNVYGAAAGNADPFTDLDDNGNNGYSQTSIGAFYTTGGLVVGAQIQPVATTATSLDSFWVGVRYGLDKVFSLNFYGSNDNAAAVDQIHITAALLAIPNLTLNGGYNATGLQTSSTSNSFIDATGAYAVTDAFKVGVTVYADDLSANTIPNGATQAYYVYKPFVTYTVSPQIALLAYFDGETAPASGATVDSQILGQLAWTPVAGVTIKFSAWYDTNSATAGTLSSNYTGNASTAGNVSQTNFAIDTKFAF